MPDLPDSTVGRISVVVLTYLRTRQLAGLLPALHAQIIDSDHDNFEVLVVDNDPAATAKAVVAGQQSPLFRYVNEPAPGIAHARNRALDETAASELLIFIDDDEVPASGWLTALLAAYRKGRPAAVTGPVVPDYETEPDSWLVGGGFFIRKQYPDGFEMPAASSANLLLDLHQVRTLGLRFDERFGITGGSDTLFTRQLIQRGGTIVFAADAAVIDRVPANRMTRDWVLRRFYRVGNTWSRTSVELAPRGLRRLTTRLGLTARGAARAGFGIARAGVGRIGGSAGHQARGSRAIRRGLGMMAGAWGGIYSEYQRPTTGAEL